MAIANLDETLLSYAWRKSQLTLEISQLQGRKHLALLSRGDVNQIQAQEEQELRDYYKAVFEGDEDYQGKYADYTQIPDFCEELSKISARYQEELEQIAAWEQELDNQITVNSAEMEEINAFQEQFKTYLSSNIQNDFSLELN